MSSKDDADTTNGEKHQEGKPLRKKYARKSGAISSRDSSLSQIEKSCTHA